MAHTPGPWFWDGEPGKSNLRAAERGCVISYAAYEGLWFSGYDVSGRDEPALSAGIGDIDIANARLISAAPELLAALELILPLAKGYAAQNRVGSNAAYIAAAEAAIAKAEGR